MRDGNMLDFPFARRQLCIAFAGGRHAVEMAPSTQFPRKNEPVIRCPEELLIRLNAMKDAAWSWLGTKDLMTKAGPCIRDSDRPRIAFTARTSTRETAACRYSDVGDVCAIWRPYRLGITVHAGIEIPECSIRRAIHANQLMILAIADKG